MDIFDSQYYRLNKFLLKCAGFWPYQSWSSKLFFLSLTIFGLIVYSIPQIIYLLEVRNDLNVILESIPTAFGSLIAVSKTIGVMYKSVEFRKLLDRTREDWIYLDGTSDLEIMKKHALYSQKFSLWYTILLFLAVFLFIMVPLVIHIAQVILSANDTVARDLFHPGEYFVDQHKNYYYLIFLESYAYVISGFVVTSIDTGYIIAIQHCVGILNILSKRISAALEDSKELFQYTKKDPDMEMHLYRCTINCVCIHKRALEFVKLIQLTYGTILFPDIVCGILAHCLASSAALMYSDRHSLLARCIVIMLGQKMRLFIYSYPGQMLMDYSVLIRFKAYEALWYEMSLKIQKVLMLLMLKSETPCTVTVAKIYNANLDTFAAVIKSSLSYSMVIASFQEASNK